MKIKKLEITGFKSFLEKSAIEFAQGISAIVGPNGCGKSNIIDAIRWAMGEQSAKQLRGKTMEDVIFSGSDGKSPAGFAEVAMLLENDNGSAPEELKDFTEIMISRRVYRSGETAYSLNKRPCRLKDIHNIFLGSGMGTRSYALIQQGNIGMITEAGPEEKRLFVEEAAGISRYKARKKETLQKLESTHQNLLRVNDIISEVSHQMMSLKRQARRAERFLEYREKLKVLDVEISVRLHDDISGEIEETDSLMQSLKDTEVHHFSQITVLEAAVEKIKINHWKKGQEISREKSGKFDIQRQIDKAENELGHLRKQKDLLFQEIRELESARVTISEKNSDITREIAEVEAMTETFFRALQAHGQKLELARQEESRLKDVIAPLHGQLEDQKKRFTSLTALEARYNNIFQTATRNGETIRRRMKRTDEELFTVETQLEKFTRDAKESESDLRSIKENAETISKSIDDLKSRVSEKAKTLAGQVKTVQSLDLARKEAKSNYAALKKMADNFEWFKDGVKAVMTGVKEAIQQNRPGAVMHLVSDVVTATPAYEVAVEAALGETLQYVLVDDQKTAFEAVEILESQNLGRCGFVPLSEVKTALPEKNDPVIPESSLVSYVSIKEGFKPSINALLGSVTVVADAVEALSLWKQNGSKNTIVTRSGEVITHQGIFIGGSRNSFPGILSKNREMTDLQNRITWIDQELDSARSCQQKLEEQLRQLETDLQEHIEEKNRCTRSELEAEKSLFKATEAVKQAQRHREILHLEQEQLMGEHTDTEEEIAKYHEELGKLLQDVKNTQQAIDMLTAAIHDGTQAIESHHEKIVEIQLESTGTSANLENARSTLKRLKDFESDAHERLKLMDLDISRKTQKHAESLLKIEILESSLAKLYDGLQQMSALLESNETEYQAIETQLLENDSAMVKMKHVRDEIHGKIQTIELEQSQRQLRREQIEIRLQEKYHLSFSTLKQQRGNPADAATREDLEKKLLRLQEKIHRLGDVNLEAVKTYEQHKTRHEFLTRQRDDLLAAAEDLKSVIRKINRVTQERFTETFERINEKLFEVFPRLFEGGSAKLVLIEPENPSESGVELMIHPPGKKLTRLSLLSGGEKALSAIAFIFSIFLMKPSSFCLLDEIDAPLDDANIFRFNTLLKMIGEQSQIIMITHNKKSMEFSDLLLGVTMENKGISKLASVRLGREAPAASLIH